MLRLPNFRCSFAQILLTKHTPPPARRHLREVPPGGPGRLHRRGHGHRLRRRGVGGGCWASPSWTPSPTTPGSPSYAGSAPAAPRACASSSPTPTRAWCAPWAMPSRAPPGGAAWSAPSATACARPAPGPRVAMYHVARDMLRGACPKAANVLEEAEPDALAHLDFPPSHWKRLRTNNVQERANREIKRRSRMAQVFPLGGVADQARGRRHVRPGQGVGVLQVLLRGQDARAAGTRGGARGEAGPLGDGSGVRQAGHRGEPGARGQGGGQVGWRARFQPKGRRP